MIQNGARRKGHGTWLNGLKIVFSYVIPDEDASGGRDPESRNSDCLLPYIFVVSHRMS
jgi:hypothetical protein